MKTLLARSLSLLLLASALPAGAHEPSRLSAFRIAQYLNSLKASDVHVDAILGQVNTPTVSLKFHGPLREGLQKLANEGHVNLVLSGNLDETADIYFDSVPADDALKTIARTYDLALEKNGRIYTLRPVRGGAHSTSVVVTVPPVPPVPPTLDASDDSDDKAEDADNDNDNAQGADDDDRGEDAANAALHHHGKGFAQKIGAQVAEQIRQSRMHNRDQDRFGHDISVAENETVADASAFGGDARIDGHVTGDVVAFGGSVHLGEHSEVDGDVTAFGGDIRKEPGAVVHGDEATFGGDRVGSALAKSARSVSHEEASSGSIFSGWSLFAFLLEFVLCFAVGFVLMMFVPERMKVIENEMSTFPWRCGLVGFAGGFALLPLSLLFIVTLIGILLLPFLWAPVGLAVVTGFTALSSEIGKRLPILQGRRKTQAAVLALGIVVMLVLSRIPYLGIAVVVALGLFGLGAVIRTKFGSVPNGFPRPFQDTPFSGTP